MRECPELQQLLEQFGDDLAESEREAVRLHVERCPTCREHFERLRPVPATIREVSRNSDDPAVHPTDLQLALFAQYGYGANDAAELVSHLAECRSCRESVTAAWITSVRDCSGTVGCDHPARTHDDALVTRSAAYRAICALGAVLAYLGECVLLAVAVTQFVLAWVIPPTGFSAVPGIGPLLLVPAGAVRFWTLVVLALVGAALLRWTAGHLITCARSGVSREGGPT